MTQTKRRIFRKDRSASPSTTSSGAETNPTLQQPELTTTEAKTPIRMKHVTTDQADLFDFSKWDSEISPMYVVNKIFNSHHNYSRQTYLLSVLSKQLEITIKHNILSHFFFNLLNQQNKISTQKFLELIQSISSQHPDQKNTLLISLALSIELQSNRLPEEHNDYVYLVNITKSLLENSVFQIGLLKQLMNFDFLGACGISTRNMFLKSKTRELYTQDRFNLLHEENEGFSKLISIIIDPNNLSIQKLEQITNEIIQIIGFFNLEPNRVLDILLDAYENNLDSDVLLNLVRSLFNNQHLKHVIGFKLSSYHNKVTPTSLIVMIVKLMQKELFIFQDIMYYLGPHSVDDLEHFHHEYETELKRSREYTITVDGAVEKIEPRFEKSYPEFQKDQKFGLLIQLLNFDMIAEAISMLDILSKYDPHWNYDISIACCKSIEKISTPLYEKYTVLNNYISITNDDKSTIENYLFPLICHTKYELYREIKSLTKLIRLLKLYMKQPNDHHQKLVQVLASILSSLCFVGMNTSIVSEFWSILALLPYQTRYEIYGFTRQHGYEKQPKMLAQQNWVSRGIRHIFNRISFANVRTKAREILPYTVSNPIIVCEEYIRKCETYDNQIPLCVDVSQFSPEISHDIMQYCLLNRLLSNQSSNIKEDGISIATWLSNLASLYGLFFKTYPFVDMKPVLNYLTQRLKEGLWEHLVILTEIIKNTSTLEYSEEINQHQLEAQAGGKVLHSLAGTFSPNSKNTGVESMKKLKDTILSSGSGVSLVLLLAKLSNYGIHIHEDYQEWKHVADSKDMCHVAYLLLLKFLISEIKFVFEEEALGNELNSSLLIPSVDTLKAYDLSTPFIFSIVRLTRSSIPPNILQSLLPLDISNNVTSQFYNFFWMKDLSDIYVPTSLYNSTMNEYGNHRSSLVREKDEQNQKYEASMKEFKEICHKFFMAESEFVDMTTILQHCFLPRALFSAADSLYCAKLVHLLHTSETPKFSFNLFLQYLLEYVPGLLLTCTENEAKRLSRLVQFLLPTANRWYESQNEFNRECKNKPGSFVSVKKYPQLSSSTDDIYTKLDFENYQKFHFLIMENMLNNCILLLKSNDHIKIRIAMLFLSPLVKTNTFPFYSRHCDALLEISDSLKEHHVENIKVLSNTYFPLITSIRKKSENPSFIKPLLKFSVKPTNINIPSRDNEIPANSITPNTAISESELTSLTPQKQEDTLGDFSDSGSTSLSPPTTLSTNIEATIVVRGEDSTIPPIENTPLETPTVEDVKMSEASNEAIQPYDTSLPESNVEAASQDAPVEDVPKAETVVTISVEETKNTTPTITEEKPQEEAVDIEKSLTEEPKSPEYVPIEQQLENEYKSQVQESDNILDSSNSENTQSDQNMMNSKLVQLLKQKQQTKSEDKSEEVKDYVKDIQQLLILPINNPLQVIKQSQRTTENTAPSSERKQGNDSKEIRSLQSSRRIDDNLKRDTHPSSQERRLSSNASSTSSKESSQKKESETKTNKSNEDKSDIRYESSRSRNDSRETQKNENSSQKNDNSRLNRSEGRNLDNRNDRSDNSRNDRSDNRNFDNRDASRYSDRYNDRRSSSQSSSNRDNRNNDFRRNDSSSNRSDKGTSGNDRRDTRGAGDSYQSDKRNSLGGNSTSSDNNRRGSSSGELKRQYSNESSSSSSSNNRQSEHESETKKKRFHR
ncbi:predicted protein [Naegleria gruberi]|uniref:THO complex subunit 2 n=1 Tax=Naegleria gruberi TaxID=5762 RepID=D2UY91_NAEGR|nr:uncharacterized protein NAEGRDRAFT_45121 [Naegleria gruberi]EFC50430.1 predicted protein [Naegleria gruberi]|eukprot:XP_002683174.1 predicted protein [Naegleria gruberi strain NEG-M]